jgi:hypothetical protein
MAIIMQSAVQACISKTVTFCMITHYLSLKTFSLQSIYLNS